MKFTQQARQRILSLEVDTTFSVDDGGDVVVPGVTQTPEVLWHEKTDLMEVPSGWEEVSIGTYGGGRLCYPHEYLGENALDLLEEEYLDDYRHFAIVSVRDAAELDDVIGWCLLARG